MFVTHDIIKRRTPKKEYNRKNYINQLVLEFFETQSAGAKEQICCNLANFAYDPINFEYLKISNVLQIFLTSISSSNEKLILSGITGITNFCLDPTFKNDLMNPNTLKLIKSLLKNYNSDIALKALTTLTLLIDDKTINYIVDANLVSQVVSLKETTNLRLKNLIQLFLNDHCSKFAVDLKAATE